MCVVLCLLGSGTACKNAEQRAIDHVERAEALLDAPGGIFDIREAAIELRNAVALAPRDDHANALLAGTLLRLGVVEEAILYYEEAIRLAPESNDHTLGLASALLFVEPPRSRELAASVLERSPDSVDARLVLADAAALQGDHAEALRHVAEAERLSPDLPDIEWTRARVYEAKIKTLRRRPGRTIFDPRDFEATAAAYDAYIAKGGEHDSPVLLSKAKLLAAWPGHDDEATRAFVAAAEAAANDPMQEADVLDATIRHTRAHGDQAALSAALERMTELDPMRFDLWEQRIETARAAGRPAQPILDALLAAAGDQSAAHVVVARALLDEQGLTAAVAHLRSRIEAGDEAPVLYAQMVQMQTLGGRPKDAAQTLAELQAKHPDDIQTRIIVARRQLVAGEPDAALESLEAVARESGEADAMRVLARAQERLGLLEDALASIEQAIAASTRFDASLHLKKAQLLRDLSRPEEALAELDRTGGNIELSHELTLLRARCEYDVGQRSIGRRRLLELIEQPDAPLEAALALYRYEVGESNDPNRLLQIRKALVRARERSPNAYALIEALVEIDMALGRPNLAVLSVKNALLSHPLDPRLYALRAQIALEMDLPKAARVDAERALTLQPLRGDAALGVLISLFERHGDPANQVAKLETQRAEGRLKLYRKIILGRLLARHGHPREGLVLFEEALAEGAEFTVLKTDTAHLLIELGGSLDRAEALAREAAEARGEQVAAADVLGRIYMARGHYDAAMYQFQYAVDHARPASPEYLLHLGQAFEGMSRPERARDAYARALEIDPQHPGSRAALGALPGTAHPPHTDPS